MSSSVCLVIAYSFEHRRCILRLIDFSGVYEFPVNLFKDLFAYSIRPTSIFYMYQCTPTSALYSVQNVFHFLLTEN